MCVGGFLISCLEILRCIKTIVVGILVYSPFISIVKNCIFFLKTKKQGSVHFNSQGHSLNDLKVQVLYQNFRDFSRKAKESFLIQKLGTVFQKLEAILCQN